MDSVAVQRVCVPFCRRVMNRIAFLVLQIVVVRPVMNFVGAILFVNGNFDYGTVSQEEQYFNRSAAAV